MRRTLIAVTLAVLLGPARAEDLRLRTFDVSVTEGGETVAGTAKATLLSSDSTTGTAVYSLERDVSGPSSVYRHGSATVDARAKEIHVVFTKDSSTAAGIVRALDDTHDTATESDGTVRITLTLVEPPDPTVHLFAAKWAPDGHPCSEEWRELTKTVKGVDISKYQGRVDWPTLKKSGVGFAITRVSDGLTVDRTFDANWASMREGGIVRGVYQFFRASKDPIAQADLLVEKAGKTLPGDLPPFLDVEKQEKDSETGGVPVATFDANMKKWIARIRERTGRDPVVYTGSYFWNDLGHPDVGNLDLWLAEYVQDPGVSQPRLPEGWTKWTFWQYSSSAHFPGIASRVDGSLFNGTLSDLLAYAWSSGTEPSSVEPGAAASSSVKIGRKLRVGHTGVDVTAVQLALGLDPARADGVFGPETREAVKDFQRNHDLVPDGVIGLDTLRALGLGITIDRELGEGMDSAEVRALQLALGFTRDQADGIFGPDTRKAVEAYQEKHGLSVDGIAGAETLKALGLR